MSNLRKSILVLLPVTLTLATVACAPKRDERKLKPKELSYTARTADTKLALPATALLQPAAGTVPTARLLRAAEDLRALGLAEQSKGLLDAFYTSPRSTYPVAIARAPYVGAAAGATYEQAKVAVQGFATLLAAQEKLIKDFLAASPLEIPEKSLNTVAMIEVVETHIQKIKDFVGSPAVNPLVRKEMLDELRREADLKLPPLKELLQTLERAKTVGEVLKQVDVLMEAANATVDEASRQNIAFGQKLHRRIESVNDSADVLEAVVMIWEFLSPAEREQLIRPASKELYDFLHGQEADTLACMARRKDCDAIDWGQKFFVEMKIDNNGIPKLQALARTAVRDGALKIVRRNVRLALLKVPGTINARVTKNFAKYTGMLKEVLPNYKSLMETILTGWAKKDLGGAVQTQGFEARETALAEHGGAITIAPVPDEGRVTDTLTLGLSLAERATALAGESDAVTARRGYFETLNKLLAIGGYRDARKTLVPALTVSFAANDAEAKLDLEKAAASGDFWAVPDFFRAAGAGSARTSVGAAGGGAHSTGNARAIGAGGATGVGGAGVNGGGDEPLPRRASAEAQAELLRGLARVLPLLKDWSKTTYDTALGSTQAGDHLPKAFEGAELSLPLFPKEQMFSLAVANSAVLLMNLKSNLSPAFLAGQGIAPEFLPAKPAGATLAGIVDIAASEEGPRRAGVTTALGISKTILALAEFLDATADLQKTEAKALTAKSDEPGAKSAVEILAGSREEMRTLIMALANMLNQKLAAGQNGVAEALEVDGARVLAEKPKRLVDQVYAIRAFLRVGELLKSPMYKQYAVETYHFMNAKLYRAELGFYAESEAAGAVAGGGAPAGDANVNAAKDVAPNRPSVSGAMKPLDWIATAETLAAVQALIPVLEGESRAQAEKLLAVHSAALKGLRFETAPEARAE